MPDDAQAEPPVAEPPQSVNPSASPATSAGHIIVGSFWSRCTNLFHTYMGRNTNAAGEYLCTPPPVTASVLLKMHAYVFSSLQGKKHHAWKSPEESLRRICRAQQRL